MFNPESFELKKKLFNIFINNGYPKHIFRKIIYNSNFYDGSTEPSEDRVVYKKLSFIKLLSSQIVSVFKEFKNIKIARYNILKNKNLFSQIKDKTPLLYKSNVIYRIPCLGCQGSYVGQTAQWLKQRIKPSSYTICDLRKAISQKKTQKYLVFHILAIF